MFVCVRACSPFACRPSQLNLPWPMRAFMSVSQSLLLVVGVDLHFRTAHLQETSLNLATVADYL